MKEVYMSNELGQLKSILETAKKLQNGEITTPSTLKSLIDQYNTFSRENGNPKELPFIAPFDNNDVSWTYTNLAGNGPVKLSNLIININRYLNRPDKNGVGCMSLAMLVIALLGLLGIPFSGFALKLCSNDGEKTEKIDSSINVQNGSISQSPQINVYGNNNVISNSGVISDKVDDNDKKNNANAIEPQKDSSGQKRKDIDNEVCILYNDAIMINPNGIYTAGKLESILDGYNFLAGKIGKDVVNKCDRIDYGAGTVTECGKKQLETVIRNLKVYAVNNDLNCVSK